MLGLCDTPPVKGVEVEVEYSLCLAVEATCGKQFRCVGYTYLECSAENYYTPPPPTAIPPGNPLSPANPNNPNNPNNPKNPNNPNSPKVPPTTPAQIPSIPQTPFETPTIDPNVVPIENPLATAYPQWITGAVIALIVLVIILFGAVIIGGVVVAVTSGGGAAGSGIDAYQAL